MKIRSFGILFTIFSNYRLFKSFILNKVLNKTFCQINLINAHSIVEASNCNYMFNSLNKSKVNLPDGFPIFLYLKFKFKKTIQMRGMDVTKIILDIAEKSEFHVAFYGSTNEVINKLQINLKKYYPNLKISFLYSPTKNVFLKSEQSIFQQLVKKNKIDILFVGLGCPKQEKWMHNISENYDFVAVGIGAVFDFMSGNKLEAPLIIRKFGLEWLYRFLCEPRRLWRRYLLGNFLFIKILIKDLLN